MNKDKINIAIIEHLGWKPDEKNGAGGYYHHWSKGSERMIHPQPISWDTGSPCQLALNTRLLPDYTSDLNLIIALVDKLLPPDRDRYLQHLSMVVERERRMATIAWLSVTAKPIQHAEAYMKTKGIWRDDLCQ